MCSSSQIYRSVRVDVSGMAEHVNCCFIEYPGSGFNSRMQHRYLVVIGNRWLMTLIALDPRYQGVPWAAVWNQRRPALCQECRNLARIGQVTY